MSATEKSEVINQAGVYTLPNDAQLIATSSPQADALVRLGAKRTGDVPSRTKAPRVTLTSVDQDKDASDKAVAAKAISEQQEAQAKVDAGDEPVEAVAEEPVVEKKVSKKSSK